MTSFVTRYDFRVPGAGSDQLRGEFFARALEQATYAEAHGHDALMLSEHHGSDDGYLPSPLLVGAAFAAVTSRIALSISALLVNLYDPLRLAEDIAVLDHLSAGRTSFTLGLGYRPVEYAMFDRPWGTRGQDIEDTIEVLLQAWTGEEFTHRGRRVQVTPTPYTRPRPMLFYGGGSPAAARRAGRLGLGFAPQQPDPELREIYDAECRAHGREPGFALMVPPGPANVFCAEDPEAFWAAYGHHLLADAQGYAAWHGETESYVRDDSATTAELRAAGKYAVFTPEALIEKCRSREIRLVTSHPACGGLPTEPSWESLRLISETVMPAVRAPTAR